MDPEFKDCSGEAELKPISKNLVGIITLSTDLTTERDYRRVIPFGIFDYYVNRLPYNNPTNEHNLRKLFGEIARGSEKILPGLALQAVVFSCTSATLFIKHTDIEREVQKVKQTAKVITPLQAVAEILKLMKKKKISILTPYENTINYHMKAFFEKKEFEVISFAKFGLEKDMDMARLTSKSILKAIQSADHPKSEAIFCSCTALRVLEITEEAEKIVKKPIICSNQATIFSVLRHLRYSGSINGFGILLRNFLQQ